MDWGEYLHFFLFSYTSTRSSCTVGLLLHLQWETMRDENLWVKGRFVLWKTRYNLLTRRKVKKFKLSRPSLFWRHTVTVNLKKFSSTNIFKLYTCGKFYMFKFNDFSGRPRKVKARFQKFFYWPLCEWFWKYKYCWYIIKNTCIGVIHHKLHGSVYTGSYAYNSLFI